MVIDLPQPGRKYYSEKKLGTKDFVVQTTLHTGKHIPQMKKCTS